MTIEMKKVWFDGEKVVTQNILASDIYKRHWDIASCKAYAEQLRDKNRANTAEHAAEAIEYLLALAQPEQEPVAWKLMPRDATNAMLKAMDECSTEGYDERLYAGHAASVYMAAWDEAPTPPQRPWVGLTEDDKVLIKHDANFNQFMTAGEYADRVQQLTEARLKDKNT